MQQNEGETLVLTHGLLSRLQMTHIRCKGDAIFAKRMTKDLIVFI